MAVVHTVFNQVRRFARALPSKQRNNILAMANALDKAAHSSDTAEIVLSQRESGATLAATTDGLLATYTANKVTRTIYYYLTDSAGRIHEWADGIALDVTLTKSSTNGLYSLTDTYAATTTGTVTLVKGIATLTTYIRNTRGFQTLSKTGCHTSPTTSDTGLAPGDYKFKIAYNGATAVTITLTLAGTTHYSDLITALNTATSGYATWSLITDKIKCISDSDATGSAISIAAPDSGTNLFGASGINASAIDTATARAAIADHDTFTTTIANETILGVTVTGKANVLTVHTSL